MERCSVDWRTYSSARGSVLEVIRSGMTIPPGSIIFEDPPAHDLHRGLLSRVFTPRRMGELEGKIRELCARSLDPLVGAGGFDFVRDLGAQMPMRTIGMLLGIPEQDQEVIRDRIDEGLRLEEGTMLDVADQYGGERREGGEFAEYIDWRAEHPDQRQELVEDRSLVPNAVEELLRYESPSPVQARYVTEDVEHYGQVVPEGSVMLVLTASGNHDERKFPGADRFDIHRRIDHHLAFGYGVHFCLGAALARLEGRVALDEVLQRFPAWDVDWDNAVRARTSTVRGWEPARDHRMTVQAPRSAGGHLAGWAGADAGPAASK